MAILQELHECSESYVAMQEAFFIRRQQEGDTLQEFSLTLMGLLEKMKQCAPIGMPNAEDLLRDQFVNLVLDSSLHLELKQLVHSLITPCLLLKQRRFSGSLKAS